MSAGETPGGVGVFGGPVPVGSAPDAPAFGDTARATGEPDSAVPEFSGDAPFAMSDSGSPVERPLDGGSEASSPPLETSFTPRPPEASSTPPPYEASITAPPPETSTPLPPPDASFARQQAPASFPPPRQPTVGATPRYPAPEAARRSPVLPPPHFSSMSPTPARSSVPSSPQHPIFAAPQQQTSGAGPLGRPFGAGPFSPQSSAPAFGPSLAPRGGNAKVWLGAGVAACVLVTGAVIAVGGERGADAAAHDSDPSMVSALSVSERPLAPKAPRVVSTETPVVPGYQVVVAPDSEAAYDVPADWVVADPMRSGGFGTPPNAVRGKGYATEGEDYCPGSTRTVSFLTGADAADSATAATQLGLRIAKVAYSNSPGGGTPGPPQPLDSLDGNQRGVFVETTGTIVDPRPGCATRYSIYTYATPTDSGNFVMVIAADTGVPNAVDPDTARRIFTSIRPHQP